MSTLTSGSMGPSVLAQGAFEGHGELGGPCPFSCPEGPAPPLAAWVVVGWQ